MEPMDLLTAVRATSATHKTTFATLAVGALGVVFGDIGTSYIPEVNRLLAVACILLVLTFRQSVKLAAAYGIAVTGTMAITSVLYYIAARYTWRWSASKSGLVLALFLSFDIPFLAANLFKFFEGGYVPMLIGATLIAGMLIWSRGRTALMEQYARRYSTFEKARPRIEQCLCSRVPGSAVVLAPDAKHVPPVLMHYVERSHSLHETVVLLNVKEAISPVVSEDSRFKVEVLGDGFYKLSVSFGYMEKPRLLPVLQTVAETGQIPFQANGATYYIGYETIIAKNGGLHRVPEAVFSYLNRNSVHEERRYGMPPEQVVEIGTQVFL
jgi:KUP system potassium uptake protein